MENSFIILISYLMGSIPFGFILTKIILKKDIRDVGSGNIGATNALRTGNKYVGYGTLFLDVLKAIITLVIIKLHYSEYIYISALSIFLGHIFPVWLKFKGGKGVATLLGILFCINYSLAFIFIVTWFIIFIISKYSSLSSLIASLAVPIFNFIFISNGDYYFFIILFVLVFYTHRDNIKRLINNTESKTKIY